MGKKQKDWIGSFRNRWSWYNTELLNETNVFTFAIAKLLLALQVITKVEWFA